MDSAVPFPEIPQPRLVIVSGLSGAGKGTILHALEDCGFFAIDNLPLALASEFVAALAGDRLPSRLAAVVMDCRDQGFAGGWAEVARQAREAGIKVSTVFVEAGDATILRRYSQMRRRHPSDSGADLAMAIAAERAALAGFRASADMVIDTSELSPHELRRRALALLTGQEQAREMRITLVSFGFKNGPPSDADMLLDVRFLPNPYFVPAMKELTGLAPAVASYVLSGETAAGFFARLLPLLVWLVPEYRREGKAYLTVGVGCTGGKHRSVAVAEEIVRRLASSGIAAVARHRDLGRE